MSACNINGCQLVTLITAVGVIISDEVSDTNELALLAAAFTQLGDTLATIAAQRAIAEAGIVIP